MILWLISALGWLRRAAQALAGLVVRYPLQAVIVAELVACVWLWSGWNGAIAERDAIRLDLNAIKAASEQAAHNAKVAHDADEARYKALAERKDDEARKAIADARAAADAYIRAHRVRGAAGSAHGTAAPAESGSAASADGQGSAPDMVAVTADDVRICTSNTIRLEAARDWALGLGE